MCSACDTTADACLMHTGGAARQQGNSAGHRGKRLWGLHRSRTDSSYGPVRAHRVSSTGRCWHHYFLHHGVPCAPGSLALLDALVERLQMSTSVMSADSSCMLTSVELNSFGSLQKSSTGLHATGQ